MTILPVSSPRPAPRETLYSYLARLAAVWLTDAPDLANDMGTRFRLLLDHEDEAFGAVADWAKLAPDAMEELLSWTGVRAGNVRMTFRGELFISKSLRNPVMRGCPICLREDAARSNGSASSGMVMRGDWQFREVALCVRHDHPIVPLWKATAQLARFDIGARLREIEANILAGALDRPKRAASGYDLWLDRRFEDGFDDTWLKDHPIFVSTVVCQALGELLSKEEASEHENTLGCMHAVGFDIAIKGEKAIRIALDQIAAASMGALDEPNKAFGRFYKQLNNYYLNDPDFDLFRDILRECILENWSIAAGEKVLGQFVPERRLHSLTTASKATGIGANLLEQFLEEAGALGAAGGRPQSRRLFDARKYAGLLAEIPTLVGPIAMRKAMGATKQELALLADEGLLIPRTRIENINKPWRISDGMALLAELSSGAMLVERESKDWETLLLASRRSSVALADLVLGIREKRLTLGQRAGVAGFHGIVVRKSEVDRVAAPRLAFRDAVLQEVPGTISAAAFGRSIGLRNDGTFLALIEAGHVPVRQVVNPRTGRPQYQMTPEDMAAFHQRFMTLTTLSAESGLHRNTLRGALLMRKITPFSSGGQDFDAVYLRDDVMEIMRRG